MNNLYFIDNVGCDDETRGLAIIPDEFFNTFKNIIEDLNKNSIYDCMPKIEVYKINKDLLREADDDCPSEILHLGDKKYVFRNPLYDFTTVIDEAITLGAPCVTGLLTVHTVATEDPLEQRSVVQYDHYIKGVERVI